MNRKTYALAALWLLSLTVAPVRSEMPGERVVLLVPRSESLIRLSGDINAMFPDRTALAVVSRRGPLALWVYDTWQAGQGNWTSLTPGQWRTGEGLPGGAARLLLIAPPAADIPENWEDVFWAGAFIRIEEKDLGAIANRLDQVFNFSRSQWLYLAERHNLRLRDRMADRRRYGRFGPPEHRLLPPRHQPDKQDKQDKPETAIAPEPIQPVGLPSVKPPEAPNENGPAMETKVPEKTKTIPDKVAPPPGLDAALEPIPADLDHDPGLNGK